MNSSPKLVPTPLILLGTSPPCSKIVLRLYPDLIAKYEWALGTVLGRDARPNCVARLVVRSCPAPFLYAMDL